MPSVALYRKVWYLQGFCRLASADMCRHAPLHVNRVVVKPVVKLSVNSDMARVLAKILGDLSSERLRNFSDDLAVADSPVHRRDTPYWRDLLEKASGWTITPHHRVLVQNVQLHLVVPALNSISAS